MKDTTRIFYGMVVVFCVMLLVNILAALTLLCGFILGAVFVIQANDEDPTILKASCKRKNEMYTGEEI